MKCAIINNWEDVTLTFLSSLASIGTTGKAWLQSFISDRPPDRGKLFSSPGLLRPHSFKPDWFWQLRCQRIWSIDRGGHFCSIWKIVENYLSVKKLLAQSATESLIIDTHWVWYAFSVVSCMVLCSNICPAFKSLSSNGTRKQERLRSSNFFE